MAIGSQSILHTKLYTLRSIAMLAIGIFLIITILTAVVVVPKINDVFESQNADKIEVDLALEAELFKLYIESKKIILEDLAQFPSLVNAAMLSDASDPILIDLFDNVVIGGESGRIVLQDIAGNVLIQTVPNLQASYSQGEPWIDQIVDGVSAYHFQLLGQRGDQFTFKISIPIKYNNFVEGVLSAEIRASLQQVFAAQKFDKHIAFKLVQDDITISTKSDHITIAHEESLELKQENVEFIYITDTALITQKESTLKNTILLVLLTGFAISFVLFAVYGFHTQSSAQQVGNAKSIFSPNYIIPMLVAAIGVAASVTAFLVSFYSHENAVTKEEISLSKEYVQRVEENINRNLDVLISLESFYNASNSVERQEFNDFTESLVARNRNIQALAWIPSVSSNDRIVYEEQAKYDGLENFEFKELGVTKRLQLAGKRDQYFPVYYVAPMEGNEKVFGFDLASNDKRLEALSKASKNGTMVATAPIELVEQESKQTGILVFYPIYHNNGVGVSTSNREYGAVKGFVLLVLKADAILDDSVADDNGVLSTYVQDITDSNNHDHFYGDVIVAEDMTFSQSINIAGRTWQIETAVKPSESEMQWLLWLVLVSGLVITAFITIGLIHLIRRRELVELLVEQRTEELKMLSSIAANSNDIFIVTSADELNADKGGPEILYVNDAFSRYTGYSIDEAIGSTPRFLQGEKTDRKQLDLIREALLKGQSYQGELINYTKEKQEYWVDINVVPLSDESGKIIQFAAVQRDITDRKREQDELVILIDKLTDSNEELARFAFVCSHDLQEPLRMIRSFSQKLQLHIADALVDDEKGQKYFRFVTEGAARAQSLIEDILSYSSIDSDTQQLQSIKGNQLIDSIRDTMQVSLQNCDGVITSDDLPELQGNRTQLFQLFQNIINNAIKYQQHDIAPHVHISVIDVGKHWQFAVSDNGIGMETRHLKKIFDVFQRLHRTSQYAGTGVGLSICKKVVERHGGTLWVESDQGVGSTFYFTLLKPHIMETINEQRRKAS